VATPFVVAFEEPYEDCDAAELSIHAELERRGFREAQNKEFFRAPPSEVVRIILSVSARSKSTSLNDDVRDVAEKDSRPWTDLLAEADALYNGVDDTIRDVDEAIRVYKLAARMGSPEACRELGSIYFFGFDVRKDDREALEWFRESVKRGGFGSYIWMARIFCGQERFEDALKAFRKFFKERSIWLGVHPFEEDRYTYDIQQYVHLCLDYGLPIEFPQFISEARADILSRVVPRLTDQIVEKERKELTRVRDTLLATLPDPLG
jgi:tetratricopeptide (TPR) repeat protein